MGEDWTKALFVDHSDLFIRFLEQGIARAEGEIEALIKIFAEFGVSVRSQVLDLCCGIGRHSLGLASRGFDVTGVDISARSIEYARTRAREIAVENRTHFIVGDVRGVSNLLSSVGKKYNAIINLSTSIGYWTDEDDRSILKQLHCLGEPNCLLIIDVSNKDYLVRHFQPFAVNVLEGKPIYVLIEKRKFLFETSRIENEWTFYRKEGEDLKHLTTILLNHRVYSLHELIDLFKGADWNYLKAYGSFSLDRLTADTSRILIVGRKPG